MYYSKKLSTFCLFYDYNSFFFKNSSENKPNDF